MGGVAARLPVPERETVRVALSVLSPRDRRRYWLAVALQVCLALMDLLGVLLLGAVGALLAAAANDSPAPSQLVGLLETLGLEDTNLLNASLVLAGAAAVLLVSKSSLALLAQMKLLKFLARREASVGAALAARFFKLPLMEVRSQSSQRTAFALVEGVSGLITGTLGSFMVVIGEIVLLTTLGAALLLIDPLTTVVAITYFAVVTWLLNRRLGGASRRAGAASAASNVASRTVTQDAVDTYPEATVMNRRDYFITRFATERRTYAGAASSAKIIVAVPRYSMEAALVIGAALVAATLALTNDVSSTVGGLVLFLAAASRVVPSLLRFNGALMTMRNQAASATAAMELTARIQGSEYIQESQAAAPAYVAEQSVDRDVVAVSRADCVLDRVSLTYPGRAQAALTDISLTIGRGMTMAVAGPSGAGKSSLVAVLLGLVQPTSGSVAIGGLDPVTLQRSQRHVLGYVPQDVAMLFGSIRENVALGIPSEQINDSDVWHALSRARLSGFVEALPDRLDTMVGERGLRLSGGQRQRLGLARALYKPPALLVMDEATSALDAETEKAIAESLTALAGDITTITVAHRLPTIRHADLVVYLDEGRIKAFGSFDEVRAAVPGFERQAQLLGL